MRLRMMFLGIIVAVLLGSPRVIAGIVPPLDLKSLCENADLIVVGSIGATWPVGQPTEIILSGIRYHVVPRAAQMNVEKVLKGQAPIANAITFTWWVANDSFRDVEPGSHGIFFLRAEQGEYKIFDPFHPHLPATGGSPSINDSCLHRVVSELVYVCMSSISSKREKIEAIEALQGLDGRNAAEGLRIAALDSDLDVRMLAIATLLDRGQKEWLGVAVDYLVSRGSEDTGYGLGPICHYVGSNMTWGTNDIPMLARLLDSPNPYVRSAGTMGLRITRVRAALGPLAKALDDSDREVQYQAIMGMAEILGISGEMAPAVKSFQSDPDRYVKHWREVAKSYKGK